MELNEFTIWEKIFSNQNQYWSKKIISREPACHLLTVENIHHESHFSLKKILENNFIENNVPIFTLKAKQYFTGLGKSENKLYVISDWFNDIQVEPIENASNLITRFNVIIEKENLYCLREFKNKAQEIINKLFKNNDINSKVLNI